jgi:RNA polymerase sigma-70 factor (ECF subfamily)
MLEDYKLLWKLKGGDTESLRRIYAKYKDRIYTISFALLNDPIAAEDVLHDVFVTFARNVTRLHFYDSPKIYLAQCTINRSQDILRSKMYKVVEVRNAADKTPVDTDTQTDIAEYDNTMSVFEVLNQVPLPQREALVLRLNAELDFKQIARVTQVSLNTAQTRYRYGLEEFRSVMNRQVE